MRPVIHEDTIPEPMTLYVECGVTEGLTRDEIRAADEWLDFWDEGAAQAGARTWHVAIPSDEAPYYAKGNGVNSTPGQVQPVRIVFMFDYKKEPTDGKTA